MDENQKKAYAEISELVKEAYAALAAAEKIADEHGVEFSFAPAYGMGGHYIPKGTGEEDWYGEPQDGWISSSSNC